MSFPIKTAIQGALRRVNDISRELELRAGKPISSAAFAKMTFTALQADDVLRSQRDQGSPEVDELRMRVTELNEALRKTRPLVYATTDVDAQIDREIVFAKMDWIVSKFTFRLGDEVDALRGQIGQARKAAEMSLAREEGARAAVSGTTNGAGNGNGSSNGYGSLIDAPTKTTTVES
ncbi:MAG: hypothetical protein M3O36_20725 [Myxococcota bacterium]|nr:hypothetical protein [Myxococcota bacterium]